MLWTLADVQEGASDRLSRAETKSTIREAIGFLRNDRVVQSLLILAVVPMVFGFPYTALLPLFARDLLHVGPAGYGLLLSISAAGALAGSTWLSLPGTRVRAGRYLILSCVGFGVGLLFFTLAPSVTAAAVTLFLVGACSQVYRTTSRITLQLHVPDALRGRILSIALMDRGFIPLGVILIGSLAGITGTKLAGAFMGVSCVGATLAVLLTRRSIWEL